MKTLLKSVLALSLVLVATAAAIQKTPIGIYTAYLQPSDVPAPPGGLPKIDPSKVKFLQLWPCRVPAFQDSLEIGLMGFVAPDLDLSDDPTAQQILQLGFAFGRELCPKAVGVTVNLKSGDPATFTKADPSQGAGNSTDSIGNTVYGSWRDKRPGLIVGYVNASRALKLSQAVDAEQARQRNAALEQQRQAEQARQAQIAARSAAFVKANGVARSVTLQQLAANPFVYQGQVVAISGVFEQMNSATQGLFSSQNKQFVVSAIPPGRFTQQNSVVMLAGRVLGNIEVKLPVLGPTLVPNLSFVGSVFCQQQGCSEYAIK